MAKKHTSKNVYDFCVAIDEAVHSVELRLVKLEERGGKEKLAVKTHTVSLCPVCGWDVSPDLPYCPNCEHANRTKKNNDEALKAEQDFTRSLMVEVEERRAEILKLDTQVAELRAENLAVRNLHSSLENALAETQRNLSNERAENLRLRNLFAMLKSTLLGDGKR
jgi:predicted RNase H-like nuclease (RuvC/YqgF family)